MFQAKRKKYGRMASCCLGLAAGVVMLMGCGPSLSYTVPQETIQRLPKGSRRSVFQARTVVTIAVDRKATIRRQKEVIKRDIEKIHQKMDKARKDGDKHLDLELTMLDFQVDYLKDKLDHQDTLQEMADRDLLLSKAQFELAKAKLVKKHSVAFDGEVSEFEAQLKDIRAAADEYRKKVDSEAAELKAVENQWLAAKKTYFSAIGESSKGWWTE